MCTKCHKIDPDGYYHDEMGWLCKRHGDQWAMVEEIFLDKDED